MYSLTNKRSNGLLSCFLDLDNTAHTKKACRGSKSRQAFLNIFYSKKLKSSPELNSTGGFPFLKMRAVRLPISRI